LDYSIVVQAKNVTARALYRDGKQRLKMGPEDCRVT